MIEAEAFFSPIIFFKTELMNPTRSLSYHWQRVLVFCMLAVGAGFFVLAEARAEAPATNPRAENLIAKTKEKIEQELRQKGFAAGQPIYVRIFKLPGTLEIWMNKGRGYDLFKTYQICNYSGFPGPKVNEGDWQSPEGFYSVSAKQMKPNSQYHLAFDIGYPNELDTSKNRSGNLIMVHGDCQSVGCFAMGDNRIEEIYMLAHAALMKGQERFNVHIFPFQMTDKNMHKFATSPWIKFWKTLEPAFSIFEKSKQIPEVAVANGEYVVSSGNTQLAMKSPTGQAK